MFCSNCGKELIEDMLFCQHCGTKKLDKLEPHETVIEPSYEKQRNTSEKLPNMLLIDSVAAIKQTFSANPEEAIITAVNSKSNVWIVFGGIYALLSALALRAILGNIIDSILSMFGVLAGFARGFIAEEISQIQNHVFIYGIITVVIYLIAVAAGMKLLYTIFNMNMPFAKIMNIVAASSLVASLAMAVSFIVSFVSVSGAYVIYIVGAIAFIIMLYRGIQKTVEFPNSPFWVFIAIVTVIELMSAVFLMPLIMPDMSMFMPDISDIFRSMF